MLLRMYVSHNLTVHLFDLLTLIILFKCSFFLVSVRKVWRGGLVSSYLTIKRSFLPLLKYPLSCLYTGVRLFCNRFNKEYTYLLYDYRCDNELDEERVE